MNKLLEAEDILTYARDHIECVFMAAGQITREEGCPIQVVAETASRKIDEAIDLLREYRESKDSAGPVPAAPDATPKSRPTRQVANRRSK
jgi:hypothetical protein